MNNVYHTFEKEAITDSEGNTFPGFHFFANIMDNPKENNFYLWRWSLFEKQRYCYTCQNNRYFRNEEPSTGGYCKDELATRYLNFIFDYVCETDCWDIFHNYNVLTTNDAFINGGLIRDKKNSRNTSTDSFRSTCSSKTVWSKPGHL